MQTTRRRHNCTRLWDRLIFEDSPYPQVQASRLSWIKEPGLQRRIFEAKLQNPNPADWAEESWNLAKSVAYKGSDGLLQIHALPPEHKTAELIAVKAPLLPDGYLKAAEDVAKSQIVLAGYRLGDQVRILFGTPRRN